MFLSNENIQKYSLNNQDYKENTEENIISDKINTEKNNLLSIKNEIKNKTLIPLIDKFSKNLKIKDIDFYLNIDKNLKNEYEKIKTWYVSFFTNIDKYLTTKDLKYRTLAWKWYIEYLKYKNIQNIENRYITKNNVNWNIFYRSKYQPISKVVISLEKKLITKLNTLLEYKNIDQNTYNETIQNYNAFILNLTLYKEFNSKEAAMKALIPGKKFLKVYKMRTIKPEKIEKKPEINYITIKDKYSFNKELKFWDYNKDVQNLQEIMKSYWYFTYPQTTMYFGNVTKESLINFSKNILNTNNPEWILTKNLIQKLYKLKYID